MLLVWMVASVVLYGQEITSSILGQITDASGAMVPAAEIVVTNPSTGISFTTTADSTGACTAPALQPGVYEVTATNLILLAASVLGSNAKENDNETFSEILLAFLRSLAVNGTRALCSDRRQRGDSRYHL
jgi:hypothetical protein